MSTTSKAAKQILEKWSANIATLSSKDRKWANVSSHFNDLWHEMWSASVTFDEAHELIPLAIKAHIPDNVTSRKTFDNMKNTQGVTYIEFLEKWKKGISDFAYQAFYVYYNPQTEEDKKEKGKYGSMSEKEYKNQRAYADSFEHIDTRNAVKKMDEGKLNTVEDILKEFGFDPESDNGNDAE